MKILLVCIVVLFTVTTNAQGWMSQGARVSALGDNGVTFIDAFAYHHNPGALGFLDKGTAGISYENRFLMKELQSQSITVAVPLKVGVISAGGQFYGYDAYRTTRAGAGYSMKLSKNIAVGVQLNYLGMQLGDYYGSKNSLSAELGALAKIGDKVRLGFSVFNITRTKLAEYRDERFGTILRLGASYQIINQLLLVGEIEQEVGYHTRIRGGLEYHPIDMLYIRAGIQGAPMNFSFGFGLAFHRFKIDLSTQYDQLLGWSPGASFIVDFYEPKKKK